MKPLLFTILLFGAANGLAQDHTGHGAPTPSSAASASSMIGYGAEERAQGLREGRGMGLAMPAEANGYPGPRHVLEVADQIDLSPAQRARTQALFDAMRTDAQRLGARLLAEEAELSAMFRERRATPALLTSTARQIGETEAALKIVHLGTHLAMMELLSTEQVARYVALRRGGAGSGRTRPEPAEAQHAR